MVVSEHGQRCARKSSGFQFLCERNVFAEAEHLLRMLAVAADTSVQ